MKTNIDMTAIISKATELNNDMVEVNRALKRIASVKCRLKKMPGRSDFQLNMTKALQEEELLKSVRDYLVGPKTTVNELSPEIIAEMDYDTVCRAIKAIQSKKTHTKWAEDCQKDEQGMYIPCSGESYKEACRIEQLLSERRKQIKPVDTSLFKKVELLNLIETLRLASDLDAATCLDRIEAFLEGGE